MSRYYWVDHTRVKGDSYNSLRRSNVRLEPVCPLNQVAWHNDLKIGRNFFVHVLTFFKVKIMKTTTLKKIFRNVMVITNSKHYELCWCCCCFFFFMNHWSFDKVYQTLNSLKEYFTLRRQPLWSRSTSQSGLAAEAIHLHFDSTLLLGFQKSAETLLLLIETLQDEFPGGLEGPRTDDGTEGAVEGFPPFKSPVSSPLGYLFRPLNPGRTFTTSTRFLLPPSYRFWISKWKN